MGSQKQEGLLLPAEPGIRMDLSLSIFLRFITFHFALVLPIIFLQFNSPMPRKITKARRLPNYGQARRGLLGGERTGDIPMRARWEHLLAQGSKRFTE